MAQDVIAPRASPPSELAVDGYGFAGSVASAEGVVRLTLHPERAAAGVPLQSAVARTSRAHSNGCATAQGWIRLFCKKMLPQMVKRSCFTVLKSGANTRKAGEDVHPADVVLTTVKGYGPPI